jgi:pimeloyl-ACP methyl ester carboxylesterase
VANAHRLAALVPGAQLRLYPGAGHAYILEAEEQALRDVEAFIGARPR